MTIEKSKTRSKNVIQEEVMSLVDLIDDQKPKLFGALTSTLNFDDKNKIWGEISGRLSELHANIRTRDDVMKKWSNILPKHKSLLQISASDETERMLIRPVPSEDIEQIKFFQQAPRKRHRLENDESESTKRAILGKEDKKLEILANIDS
ncbi:hypothetical protein LOD99_3897 [Oopsacas minuta]|uniref:Myb/SANT-like DNA-binding domain-containing protein n=1 Tax=Oopsacas minuta TaxID=111878 RepID=A0AAV7JVX2_9METZ|nr:hypothetical protein LOD99_3897 [Oopsacas minuta]